MQTKTQEAQILNHLQSGRSITPLEALTKFECMSLAQRIYDLKAAGYNVKREMVKLGKRKAVARYYMDVQ